jgi:rare lipoprotein A
MASWYGAPYHGQRSASGEIYDQEKLTAAHRTLPFGTRVRVRRPDRGGSVVVRINDRGPFVKSRVIDLSHAAAVQLGITDGGVALVILEVVEAPPLNPRPL